MIKCCQMIPYLFFKNIVGVVVVIPKYCNILHKFALEENYINCRKKFCFILRSCICAVRQELVVVNQILLKDFFINHGLHGNTVIFKTWNMLTKLGMM